MATPAPNLLHPLSLDAVLLPTMTSTVALRIGPLRIVSGHGLLHFEPDGTGLVLGNATRYVRLT